MFTHVSLYLLPQPCHPGLQVYARPSGGLPALLQALGDAGGAVREQAEAGLSRPGDASEWGFLV